MLARPVRAGFPSPVDDFIEQAIDLQSLLIANRAATFLVRVAGDSMLLAQLFDGDIAIVDRSLSPTDGDVVVVDDLKLGSSKTKEFVGVLSSLKLDGTTLIVAHAADKNLTLASRNVANVKLTTSEQLNTYEILRSDKLVFTRGAFEKVEERLSK